MDNTNETVPLEQMTSKQRDSWRMTGDLPVRDEAKPKEADAPTSAKDENENKPAPKEVEKVAASEGEEGESGTPTKTNEEHKADRTKKPGQMGYKDLRARIAELEAQIAAGKKPAAADSQAERADAKGKDEKVCPRPRSADKNADGSAKYTTWEDYEDDLLSWHSEKLRGDVKTDSAKAEQEAKVRQLNKEMNDLVQHKANEARKKYADFDEKALAKDLPIIKDSVLERWILDSDLGMDIAYHYGTHRDELDKLNAMTPFAAARELTRLEDKLSQPAKPDTTVVSVAPPKITKAPPPAREVGGRGSVAPDDETATVASGDFRAYKRVVDAKDIGKSARK